MSASAVLHAYATLTLPGGVLQHGILIEFTARDDGSALSTVTSLADPSRTATRVVSAACVQAFIGSVEEVVLGTTAPTPPCAVTETHGPDAPSTPPAAEASPPAAPG